MAGVIVTTAILRAEMADILQRVATHKTRATICRYGEPQAVVMCLEEAEELDRLRALFRRSVVQHSQEKISNA